MVFGIEMNMGNACLHSYTMEADLRVYCICVPPLTGLGGGRCVGFRKVCLDMIILAIETGTSVWYIAGRGCSKAGPLRRPRGQG